MGRPLLSEPDQHKQRLGSASEQRDIRREVREVSLGVLLPQQL